VAQSRSMAFSRQTVIYSPQPMHRSLATFAFSFSRDMAPSGQTSWHTADARVPVDSHAVSMLLLLADGRCSAHGQIFDGSPEASHLVGCEMGHDDHAVCTHDVSGQLHRGEVFLPAKYNWGIEAALDIVGGKWKPLILYALKDGTLRFSQVQNQVNPHISQRQLNAADPLARR
jgi:hypothetical protein